MKKIALPLIAICLLSACSGDAPKEKGMIKLEFNPEKGKEININYTFSVNSLSNGDVTTFEMLLSGLAIRNGDGTSTMELTNNKIKMNGAIQGVAVSGSASGPDSVKGDASLVAMPVFAFQGKTFSSVLDPTFDKKSEVQLSAGAIVDSSENKMQILLRYPQHEIKVGDTWNKELLIKAGNKMNCSAVYTLNEIKGDTAIIGIAGKLSGAGESFGNEFTIDGKLTGNFIVNIHTGWPLDSDIIEEFTLKMGGKELPMKYSMRMKIE